MIITFLIIWCPKSISKIQKIRACISVRARIVCGGLAVLAAEGPAAEHGEIVEGGGAGFLDGHGGGDR